MTIQHTCNYKQLKHSKRIRRATEVHETLVAKHSGGLVMQGLLVKGIDVLVAKHNCLRLLGAFDQHFDFTARCSFCF